MLTTRYSPGKHRSVARCAAASLAFLVGAALAALDEEPAPVADRSAWVLTIADAIGPATSDYLRRGMREAQGAGAALIVIELDTPGGLDAAMRDIIRDVIASPVPVVIYVAPSGARAASAGTYMLYAAHIAAMAPGTNLGAATPVQIGGMPDFGDDAGKKPGTGKQSAGDSDAADEETGAADDSATDDSAESSAEVPAGDAMTRKIVNDAVAYIRALAELRGRNADWAEKAVREAASLSAEQALAEGVIDIMARNLDDLLQQVDGRSVNAGGNDVTLDTAALGIVRVEADWRTRLLSVITNPNVAYMLMLLGVYGLFFEFSNPGFLVPGVIGAIALLLAMYSLQVLPVNYAGVGLMLLGIAFMVAELYVPSFGALGIGGMAAFVIGSVILFDTDSTAFRVSIAVIAAVATLTAAFFFIAIRAVLGAFRHKVVSGQEELIDSIGEMLDDFAGAGTGRIRVHSETWQAVADQPMKRGQRARVTAIDGLTLHVQPIEEKA